MAEIKAYPLDDTEYLAKDIRKWAYATTTGVFSLEENFKTIANNDMSVTVSKGVAFINDGNGGLTVWSEEEKKLVVSTANGVLNRIDAIVLCWDKISNKIFLDIKTGVESSTPVAPLPIRDNKMYELVLAHVAVNAGTILLANSMVTDTRIDSRVCGLVKSSVEEIPTEVIQNQFEEYLLKLKKSIEEAGQAQLIDGAASTSKIQDGAVTKSKLNTTLLKDLAFLDGEILVNQKGSKLPYLSTTDIYNNVQIMTIGLTSTTGSANVGQWERVLFNTIKNKIGDQLTFVSAIDGIGIRIGKGISKVLVSSTVAIERSSREADIMLAIYNKPFNVNKVQEYINGHTRADGWHGTVTVTPYLLDVKEGDVICVATKSSALNYRFQNNSILTIQKVA